MSKPFVSTALAVDKDGHLLSSSNLSGIRLFSKKGTLIDSFIPNTPSARGLKQNKFVYAFRDNKQRIWQVNFNELYFYDENKRVFKKIDTKNQFPLYGIFTQSGKILIANFNGIAELTETSNGNFDFKILDNLPKEKPHTILFEDHDNHLWSSYDATSIRIYDLKNNYNLVKELPITGVITGFWHQPQSSFVWMCSQNGLYKIDKTNWQLTVYTESAGLPCRAINAMQADAKMNLWLGTSKGLAKFDPSVNKAHAYNIVCRRVLGQKHTY